MYPEHESGKDRFRDLPTLVQGPAIRRSIYECEKVTPQVTPGAFPPFKVADNLPYPSH